MSGSSSGVASVAISAPRVGQRVGHGADARRGRERLVALQVDHDACRRSSRRCRAHSARRSVPEACAVEVMRHAARPLPASASAMRSSSAATQTSRAPAASARRATCSDQRLAAEQPQRLARQARGSVAGGNGDDEIDGMPSCRVLLHGVRPASLVQQRDPERFRQFRAHRHAEMAAGRRSRGISPRPSRSSAPAGRCRTANRSAT